MQTWLATLLIGILLLGGKENGRKTSSLERTDSTVSSEASPDKAQTPTQMESTQTKEVAQDPPRPRLNPAICKDIEKKLKNLSFPYKVEMTLLPEQTPFSSEVESEIKSKTKFLDPLGEIYPIYPKGTIWLIGSGIDPARFSAWALLVDENCQV